MELWPIAVYFVVVVVMVGAILALSWVLGERHRDRKTGTVYESGIVPYGTARVRYGAQFYLVAMLFVVFDVEAAFIVAWAVAGRELGWAGYVELVVFVGILVAALGYLWAGGALEMHKRPATARHSGGRR